MGQSIFSTKSPIIKMNKLSMTVMLALGLTAVAAEGNLRMQEEASTTMAPAAGETTTMSPDDSETTTMSPDDSETTTTEEPSTSAGSALSASIALTATAVAVAVAQAL